MDLLPKPNYRLNKKEEINPDEPVLKAYNTLYQYFDERGKLLENRGRRGKEVFRDNQKKLDTLLREQLNGRWPIYPADPQLEEALRTQNKRYKNPLTTIY